MSTSHTSPGPGGVDYVLACQVDPETKYHFFPLSTYESSKDTVSVCKRLTNHFDGKEMMTVGFDYVENICKVCQRFGLLLKLGE